jgi:hypothetical protein
MAYIRDMYNERKTQDLHRHLVLCNWSRSTLLGLNKICLLYEQLFIYTTTACQLFNHLSLWWLLFNILGRRNIFFLYSWLIVTEMFYRHDLKLIKVSPLVIHIIHNHHNIYIKTSFVDKIQVSFYKELWETI